MRPTKITAFIALVAVFVSLLVLSFTSRAGGETHGAAPRNSQNGMTTLPSGNSVVSSFNGAGQEGQAALQAARLALQDAIDSGNFEMMSSAKQMTLQLQARMRYTGGVLKEMTLPAALPATPRDGSPATDVPLPQVPDVLANPLVNNPALDTTSQKTQSETTIVLTSATTLVAAYNDSGSFTGGNKFTGYSTSTDAGASWTDRGTVPEAVVGNFGDPVLARNNATGKVYLATLAAVTNGMNVYSSTDNGVTWNGPANGAPGTAAASGDKEWITVDNFAGTGSGNVYHAYRDFAAGGGVRFTRSTDNGATFGPSPGLLIDNASTVQGAFVFVGSTHAVYVGYYNAGSIKLRKSTDQGLTFAASVPVSTLVTTGVNGSLNVPAGYRSSAFPQFVASPINANLLFSIHPDITVAGGSDSNIFFNQSTDGGATWSANVRLNSDAGTNVQTQPSIAIMPDGSALCVTWQDSRTDPANRKVQRFGVIGTISGTTVTFGTNFIVSQPNWTPVFGSDPVVNTVYMGDYDASTADNSNFYTTFVDCRLGDQDTRFAKIPKAGPPPSTLISVSSFNPTSLAVSPNTCNNLFVTLTNDGDLAATAVSLSLATSTAGVTIQASPQSYGNIGAGASATNATPFKLSIASSFVCGTSIVINWTSSTGETGSFTITTQGNGYTFTTTTGQSIVPGTTDIGNHTDDLVTAVALPFTFNYYSTPFTSANVSSNGNLQFTSSNNEFSNTCLPASVLNNPIMPFWDDLITSPAGNGIFTSVSGSAPNRIFNIEWRATYISTTISVNFEVRLYETTNQIDFVYGVLNGTGTSATVGMQKGTGSGGSSDISSFSCNQASLSNGLKISWTFSPTCPQGTGTCAAGTVSIAGNVDYCSNPSLPPVPGVTLTLTGTTGASTSSDGSGNYTFPSLPSGGNYTVTPTRAALSPSATGIDTIDAIATQRHFLSIGPPLAGCRLTAADVNGNVTVDTIDVIAIQRFFLGFTTGIANTGQYKFTPVNRSYSAITNNQTAQNYDALIFGDVATGFVHRPDGTEDMGSSQAEATVATVALPEVAVDQSKSNFVAAVRTSEIEAKNQLVGFQGDFTFDERVVTFQSDPVQKAGITGGNWNVSGNVLPGAGPIRTLRVSALSNDFMPLSGSGTLFELRIASVNQVAQGTPLLWAAAPDQFIFIDADLNTQKPGNAASGSVAVRGRFSEARRAGGN